MHRILSQVGMYRNSLQCLHAAEPIAGQSSDPLEPKLGGVTSCTSLHATHEAQRSHSRSLQLQHLPRSLYEQFDITRHRSGRSLTENTQAILDKDSNYFILSIVNEILACHIGIPSFVPESEESGQRTNR